MTKVPLFVIANVARRSIIIVNTVSRERLTVQHTRNIHERNHLHLR